MASARVGKPVEVRPPAPDMALVRKAAAALRSAKKPVLVVGSQATLDAPGIAQVAAAVERIGAPVYLSGMARGLLGRDHPLHVRHKRRDALREADLVLLAGTPADFRLDYGNHIRRSATYIGVNRSRRDLSLNREPNVAVRADPGLFLKRLAEEFAHDERWAEWRASLRARDDARNAEIAEQMRAPGDKVNALHLCAEIDARVGPNTILVADGGDFVATAAYVIQPPGPLAWLDPGVFGTLGVGAGFALGAKLARPDADVWVLYGDGSVGYSLTEFDTFTRHGINVLAVVGNDAGWTQIAREQVELLGSPVGTVLAHSDYHAVAAGFGAAGFAVRDPELVEETLQQAQEAAQAGKPALVNAILGKSEFRKGSVSM
jgi:acetolactate synthase-1/2/3 large subunit